TPSRAPRPENAVRHVGTSRAPAWMHAIHPCWCRAEELPMKRTLPEGRAVYAATPSESRLTDTSPSCPPPPERVPGERAEEQAREPHPAAVIRALAPTVAEWVATPAGSTPQ